MYFNYRKFCSIVQLALVNARYEFSMVDIGDYERLSDSSVYANSNLGRVKNQNMLQLPTAREPVNNVCKKYPYVFIGDKAFPLPCYLLKSFSRNAL